MTIVAEVMVVVPVSVSISIEVVGIVIQVSKAWEVVVSMTEVS